MQGKKPSSLILLFDLFLCDEIQSMYKSYVEE